MSSTLIEHLEFALTVDAGDRVIRDAAILVEDGRIAAIGRSEEVSREGVDTVVNGRRRGIVPGFLDHDSTLALRENEPRQKHRSNDQ